MLLRGAGWGAPQSQMVWKKTKRILIFVSKWRSFHVWSGSCRPTSTTLLLISHIRAPQRNRNTPSPGTTHWDTCIPVSLFFRKFYRGLPISSLIIKNKLSFYFLSVNPSHTRPIQFRRWRPSQTLLRYAPKRNA